MPTTEPHDTKPLQYNLRKLQFAIFASENKGTVFWQLNVTVNSFIFLAISIAVSVKQWSGVCPFFTINRQYLNSASIHFSLSAWRLIHLLDVSMVSVK